MTFTRNKYIAQKVAATTTAIAAIPTKKAQLQIQQCARPTTTKATTAATRTKQI